MKVGWNRRYVLHCLVCLEWLAKTTKTLVFTGLLSSFVFAFPVATEVASAPEGGMRFSPAQVSAREADQRVAVEKMLSPYGADPEQLERIVGAIMTSSKKYRVDPLLISSIVVVESGANPFAVSNADSVGIMQIHLGTWGDTALKENLNLFKIEDNVELGVRILRDYISISDIWEGVARYRGKTDDPASQATAQEYVEKVQKIYGYVPSTAVN
jgi:soluble lytic murein transglycosylase-like protein